MFIHSIQHGPSQGIFAAIKLIEEAKSEVLLSTYVLEGQGHGGTCLIDALRKTNARTIKILSNHYTFHSKKTLKYLGRIACVANKLRNDQTLHIRVWKHNFFNSNHAKFVVVDETKCALGGYNFQEAFFMPNDLAWSDLGITLTSVSLGKTLRQHFDTMWQGASDVSCNQTLKMISCQCPKQAVGRVLQINQTVTDYVMLTQLPQCLFIHSQKSQAFYSIMQCLSTAEKSIDILSPNVIDTCIWELLTHKLSTIKNFSVRILTNDGLNKSQSFMVLMQKEKIYFCNQRKKWKHLQIRFSNDTTKNKKKQYLETDEKEWTVLIDHSKYFNVDLKHFYIGSFNMDAISLHASGESGVIILNEPHLAQKTNHFLFEFCWFKATELNCFFAYEQ